MGLNSMDIRIEHEEFFLCTNKEHREQRFIIYEESGEPDHPVFCPWCGKTEFVEKAE